MIDFKPHDYQDFAIQHIIDHKVSGLLLEMGLGKTVSSLTAVEQLMYERFKIQRILVCAPKNVALDTWPTEIEKWAHTKYLRYSMITGTEKQRLSGMHSEADIYITNVDNISWLIEQHGRYTNKAKKSGFTVTKPWKFDTVIIDELSGFKNPASKRFKLFKKIRPYIDRIIGLTGTPAPNSLLDLWGQMYVLDMGARLGKTMTAYRDRYFVPGGYVKNAHGRLIGKDYVPRPGSEDAIYQAIGDICVSMKSIDHLSLPEVMFKDYGVKLKPGERRLYNELEKEYFLELQDDIIDAVSAASLSSKLHQLSQGAIYIDTEEAENGEWREIHTQKLEILDDIIEEAAGQSVLVFYWFHHDLERLKKKFKNAVDLKSKNQDELQAKIRAWNKGEIPILLAHPKSAGHGLNLQAGGHIAVWFSLTWSLEAYLQANARLNRQGQTKPVTINHIIIRDTVDERILEVLKGKEEQQNALMEAVKAVLKKYKDA